MDTVQIEDVTKTFGEHTAVDSLSLTVPTGSIYGFIGPNGSGKTTTLRMIMGIFYPDMGAIRVFVNKHQGARSERIGYLPEERGLYRKMKVRELLRFYGGLKSNRSVKEEVDMWLEKLDLTKWADSKVEALSKGMSQKVQFISAVVTKPELLILDEPFSGLDPVNADLLKDVILELQKKGATIIFSTHDMSMAEKMCDYIFMIYQGRKVLDGTLTHIQEQYGNDTIQIQSEVGASALKGIAGIEKVNDFGKLQEVRVSSGADPQEILIELLKKTRISRFEIAKPSLNDIFIRIASPERKEAHHE